MDEADERRQARLVRTDGLAGDIRDGLDVRTGRPPASLERAHCPPPFSPAAGGLCEQGMPSS